MSFNTKKITWGIAGLLALASVAFLFTTAIVPYGASADSTQAREDLLPADGGVFNPFIETHIDIVQGGTRARVSVSNTSASNEYTISMASYELHTAYGSPDFISSQTLFDSRTRTIGPGETITFGPSLPSCNYQVDLFEGPSVPQTNPDFGAEPLISTHTLFDWIIALDQGTCGGDDPELSVEKTGPNTISPGEVVSYDIRVRNTGEVAVVAADYRIIDNVNAPLTYLSGTPNCVYEANSGGARGRVVCTGDTDLEPGEHSDFTLTFRVDAAAQCAPFTNKVDVQLNGGSVWEQADWDTATTTISGCGETAILILEKRVVNDNGGTAVPADFDLWFYNRNDATARTHTTTLEEHIVEPGSYRAGESPFEGYTRQGGWFGDCDYNGLVTLEAGDVAHCIVVNNDIPEVGVDPELSIEKTGPDTVRPGQVATYRLTVTNTGEVTVPSYIVTDEVPEPLTYLRGNPNCALANGVVECASPHALDVGESQVFQIVFRVDREDQLASCPLAFDNRGVVTAPGITDSDTTETTVICAPGEDEPELSIEKTGPDTVRPGQRITYGLKVTNTGTVSVDVYTVTDEVHTTLTYLSGPSDCALAGGVVSCDGPAALVAGASHIFELVFRVDSEGALSSCPFTYSNTGVVNGPDIDSDSDTVETTIICDSSETAQIRLIKEVINDNGGALQVSDFPLFVSGQRVRSGQIITVTPGSYVASEQNQPGYTAGVWTGDCAANGSVTLLPGDFKECRIINNDNPGGQCVIPGVSLPDDGIITGRIGDAINYTFNVSGTAPVTVSLEGTLPAGLTFDENTLTISGTPTATTDSDGTVVTVRAVNACGSDVALITIVIVGQNQCIPPVFVTPELNTDITSRVNEPFSYEIQTQHTGGGSVEIFVSALPAGLTLNGTTIEGTPTQIGSFTITITIADENDIQCSASRDMAITITGGTTGCVTNCGGGQDPPKVVLFGDPSGQPLASASFVFLSQVPYTGLGLDIVQAVLFLLGLLVISGVGAYGVMRGGGTVTERIRRTLTRIKTAFVEAYTVPVATVAKHKQQKDSYEEAYHREQKSVAHNVVDAPVADTDIDTDYTEYLTMTAPKEKAVTPENLPTTEVSTSADVAPTPETNHIPVLVQTVAREEKVLLSKDAALMITGTARDTEHAQEIARQVIDIAKGKYPREDGWLVLDESRTRKVLFISAIQMTPLFIDWLVRGEDKKVFTFLRRLRGQKQPIADFMRAVVTELDNAHQARLEGTTDAVDMFTMDTLEAMGTQQLERLIGTLLRGVDERYDESYTSARLALVRALDMVRKNELIQSGDAYGTTHTMAQQSNRELA